MDEELRNRLIEHSGLLKKAKYYGHQLGENENPLDRDYLLGILIDVIAAQLQLDRKLKEIGL